MMGHLIKPFGTLKSIFLQKWSALMMDLDPNVHLGVRGVQLGAGHVVLCTWVIPAHVHYLALGDVEGHSPGVRPGD